MQVDCQHSESALRVQRNLRVRLSQARGQICAIVSLHACSKRVRRQLTFLCVRLQIEVTNSLVSCPIVTRCYEQGDHDAYAAVTRSLACLVPFLRAASLGHALAS